MAHGAVNGSMLKGRFTEDDECNKKQRSKISKIAIVRYSKLFFHPSQLQVPKWRSVVFPRNCGMKIDDVQWCLLTCNNVRMICNLCVWTRA